MRFKYDLEKPRMYRKVAHKNYICSLPPRLRLYCAITKTLERRMLLPSIYVHHKIFFIECFIQIKALLLDRNSLQLKPLEHEHL